MTNNKDIPVQFQAFTVIKIDHSDYTSTIRVEGQTRTYYWHLGRLTYSRAEDRHEITMPVVGQAVRQEIKRIIDRALGYNINMPESNEAAREQLRKTFGCC